jgi:hypothetical protein
MMSATLYCQVSLPVDEEKRGRDQHLGSSDVRQLGFSSSLPLTTLGVCEALVSVLQDCNELDVRAELTHHHNRSLHGE